MIPIPNDMYTDWRLFEEILFHLMSNAIKFNKHGGAVAIDLSFTDLNLEETDLTWTNE